MSLKGELILSYLVIGLVFILLLVTSSGGKHDFLNYGFLGYIPGDC